jgi:hypothetical protein
VLVKLGVSCTAGRHCIWTLQLAFCRVCVGCGATALVVGYELLRPAGCPRRLSI